MIKKFQAPVGPISKIVGKPIVLIGDDIDTDRIIPARFLKCVNFDNLGQSVFEDDRKNLKGKHPFDLESNKGSSILIVNSNFGCGSSREHAPQALLRWGIRAIIGESFAEIFYCNCIAIGIPCFTLPKKLIKNIQENKNINNSLCEINIKESTFKSTFFNFDLEIKISSKNMFLSGDWDATSTLLANRKLIEKKINDLPYTKFNQSNELFETI
jgi:3-isopropylmalate/(R)-2-methylmalate dehydratase small subunit